MVHFSIGQAMLQNQQQQLHHPSQHQMARQEAAEGQTKAKGRKGAPSGHKECSGGTLTWSPSEVEHAKIQANNFQRLERHCKWRGGCEWCGWGWRWRWQVFGGENSNKLADVLRQMCWESFEWIQQLWWCSQLGKWTNSLPCWACDHWSEFTRRARKFKWRGNIFKYNVWDTTGRKVIPAWLFRVNKWCWCGQISKQ